MNSNTVQLANSGYIPAACAARAAGGVAQGKRLRAIVREVTALNLALMREAPE